jgi:imidazoleglycerol-phosphate dehydratase
MNEKSNRSAEISRKTNETDIQLEINLDGSGSYSIDTGVPFFDHMLSQLSRHSNMDINLKAKGDIEIDAHHTVEDVGICLGKALAIALGDLQGIVRYGDAQVPMEESLAHAAIDLCGRSNLVYNVKTTAATVGNFDSELSEEFFRALVSNGRFTLHVNLVYGGNQHHILEGVFKSVARALRLAMARSKDGSVPSTKGTL